MAGLFGGLFDKVSSPEKLWADVMALVTRPETAGPTDTAADDPVPTLWLLGRTGAGKTSLIAALTGDSRAEIGNGATPCTRTALRYDWPAGRPLLRFLDTRGLGEADYDATEDIAAAARSAHVLVAVLKLADPKQGDVLKVVQQVRRRQPDWPLVVVQTGLHVFYPPNADHPPVYPYTGGAEDIRNPALPPDLRRAMQFQRALFEGMPGAAPFFVAVDFTRPEDGFTPVNYGLEALLDALREAGFAHMLTGEERLAGAEGDRLAQEARNLILAYAAGAGTAGAVPLPLVGIGGLAGTIALMLRALAGRYEVEWTRERMLEFAGAIGAGAAAGFAVQYGARELLKLVPGAGTIAGGALNAAAGGALVYGIGYAACRYLSAIRSRRTVDREAVRAAYEAAFAEAGRSLKNRLLPSPPVRETP